ncbi:septal ring lytic transglycosylase RlpA family protein [Novosphingobium sp.]|uniref:septal ring lytic transglycosylase RlpA family protein n=1 Tax=Novosphingobium sp. TaxID=1874826 RepID=UPI0028AE71C0|nr:septal ring lytic transglycosylase RlpA family protein [Novosphingobium sp.]
MTGKHNQPHKAQRLARIGFALATAAMLVAPASSAVAESRLAPAKAPESIAPAPAAVISTAAATAPVAAIPQALEQEAQEFEAIKGGTASFYGRELRGNRTASGERFNPDDLTAAHPSLPFGTMLRVTNPRNGDSVMVRVNDRGPFHSNRVIDLSEAAAKEIGIARMGSGKVELAVLNDGTSDE